MVTAAETHFSQPAGQVPAVVGVALRSWLASHGLSAPSVKVRGSATRGEWRSAPEKAKAL